MAENPKRPLPNKGFVFSSSALLVKPILKENYFANESSHDFGFNISAGYKDNSGFDYILNYKHFDVESSWNNSTACTSGMTLIPGCGGAGSNPLGSEVAGNVNYDLSYDGFDFQIGKDFPLSHSVTLNLFGGLRYLGIDEKYTSIFLAINGKSDLLRNEGLFHLQGVGLSAGIAPAYTAFDGRLRFLSNVSGSYIAAKIRNGTTRTTDSLYAIDASVGIGYLLHTALGGLDIKVGYEYENFDLSESGNYQLEYEGHDGAYGSLEYILDDKGLVFDSEGNSYQLDGGYSWSPSEEIINGWRSSSESSHNIGGRASISLQNIGLLTLKGRYIDNNNSSGSETYLLDANLTVPLTEYLSSSLKILGAKNYSSTSYTNSTGNLYSFGGGLFLHDSEHGRLGIDVQHLTSQNTYQDTNLFSGFSINYTQQTKLTSHYYFFTLYGSWYSDDLTVNALTGLYELDSFTHNSPHQISTKNSSGYWDVSADWYPLANTKLTIGGNIVESNKLLRTGISHQLFDNLQLGFDFKMIEYLRYTDNTYGFNLTYHFGNKSSIKTRDRNLQQTGASNSDVLYGNIRF